MAAILIAGEVASALDFNSEAPAHVVTNTVPSAHVPWAKPLAGGPIRVLMIAPRFTLRDAVELEQRADVRLEVVGLWDSTHLGCDPLRPVEGAAEEEVRQRLQQQLQKRWDVLILANLDVAVLPEAEQYALLEHVNQGAGLLLAHHRASQSCSLVTFLNSLPPQAEAGDLARGIGETGGRGWLSGKVPVSTSEAGAGRVVQLTYPGDPPRTHALIAVPADPLNAPLALLDNSFAFVIRCLLWAARRDPEVFISDIIDIAPKGPTEEEIPPGLTTEFVQSVRDSVTNQPLRPFRLQLNAEADRDYEVLYQLRSGERTVPVPSPEAILPNGAEQYAIDILSRPGTFFLDVWLRSRKGTHDWFTKRIEVPGWPGLLNVRASKTFLLPNDAMDITAEIRPVFSVVDINSASKPRTGVLYARAEDNTGQVVAENHMPVTTEGGRLHLPLQFADLTAPLVKVNVYVLEGPKRDFSAWELLEEPGQTILLPVRQPPRTPEFQLLVTAPALDEYNERFYLRELHDHGARLLYAPAGDTALVYAAEAQLGLVPELARYQVAAAREGAIREPCLTDPDYQHTQSLQVQELAGFHWAGSSGLYSLGNGNCLTLSEENVCQSPTCLQGFQHWLESAYGTLERLNQSWKSEYAAWNEILPLDQDEARSTQRYAPWVDFRTYMDAVFSAFHGKMRASILAVDPQAKIGFRALDTANPSFGYCWPDLFRSMDWLAAGPDPGLLVRAQSYAAQGAASGLVLDDSLPASYWVWAALLHQAPTLWWPAAYGAAETPGAASAVLPDGRIAPEFAAVADLVTRLSADVAPLVLHATATPPAIALYDSPASRHLNEVAAPPGRGSFDAEASLLHGVQRLGRQARFITASELPGLASTDRVLLLPAVSALSTGEIAGMQHIAEAGGRIMALGTPGLFDEHGAPRDTPPLDVLFAGDPSGAHAVLDWDDPEMLQILEDAFAEAEIGPAVPLREKGPHFLGECYQFTYGQAEILALLAGPTAEDEQRVRLSLPKDAHVYDVQTHLPVLSPKRVSARIAPGTAAVFSILPYEVEGVTLLAPGTAYAGRRLEFRVHVAVHSGAAGAHLLRIDLSPEFGEPLLPYRRFVPCAAGLGGDYLPLALNLPPGRYVLTATDLLTGLQQNAYLSIGQAPEG